MEFIQSDNTPGTRRQANRMMAGANGILLPCTIASWLLLLGWYVAGGANVTEKLDTRIVGGQPTTIAQTPYIVMVRYDGLFSCGGSLVSRRHVVTAAHCVQGRTLSLFVIVAGATRLTDPGVRSRVSAAYLPRRYDPDTFNQDVSVLRLATALSGPNVKPIRLCNSRMRINNMVRVSGWGLRSETGTDLSYRLRTVNVPIISQQSCRRSYRGTNVIGESMFCAAVPGSRDSCSGDSGGPLVYRGRLCGIVSFGVGCAERAFPGVYTSVNNVKRFIVNSVKR